MTGRNGSSDTRKHPEESLVLDIDLTRGLVAALLVVAAVVALALLVRGPTPASAAGEAVSAASENMRHYYFGYSVHANSAIDGCAPGYHFASLWEILDPSNLVFDEAAPSVTRTDVGGGPPTELVGWVRTGYSANVSNTAGHANCSAWTSVSGGEYGTTAQLPSDWLTGGELHVWDVGTRACSQVAYIWCVED
jgi:hypothetical protein